MFGLPVQEPAAKLSTSHVLMDGVLLGQKSGFAKAATEFKWIFAANNQHWVKSPQNDDWWIHKWLTRSPEMMLSPIDGQDNTGLFWDNFCFFLNKKFDRSLGQAIIITCVSIKLFVILARFVGAFDIIAVFANLLKLLCHVSLNAASTFRSHFADALVVFCVVH